MRRLILHNQQAPGDVVMLTAAIRDIHRCHPGAFVTDVRTKWAEIWENNPYITPLDDHDPDVQHIECHYPLIHRSNQEPYHFLHGFIQYLNQKLKTRIRPTAFRGDIHLSQTERDTPSMVEQIVGRSVPYWMCLSGGKYDFTCKWWDVSRMQEVVDRLRGRVLFVQVGNSQDYHPPLARALDLRGKTTLRDLIRLVYNAQGVLCPVTLLMHLAAAVEPRPPALSRACVVLAGGREPAHWEQYPGHQFLHTIGLLECCATKGCWKSRVFALGDGAENDQANRRCVNTVGTLPRCMELITSADVSTRIEAHFHGGMMRELLPEEAEAATAVIEGPKLKGSQEIALSPQNARDASECFLRSIAECPYPNGFAGRGIVICGGGVQYFTNAWVCIKILRHLRCALPIELWHLGSQEMTPMMLSILAELGVRTVDATALARNKATRILGGWELKAYSILHCSFEEVLLLDADNVAVEDPSYLFETKEFREVGAVFWPDFGRLPANRAIWSLTGVPWRDEPEFESGQILVNKRKCWQALQLAMWYNEHSDFFYKHIHGDKETFHLAFRKVDKSYCMPPRGIHALRGTMCQHDFDGRRVFQHRNLCKWSLFRRNRRIIDFWLEAECLEFLNQLREKWDGRVPWLCRYDPANQDQATAATVEDILEKSFIYSRVGHDERPITFLKNGLIGKGAAEQEVFWGLEVEPDGPLLKISSEQRLTCALRHHEAGLWRGRWLVHEKMPIEVIPTDEPADPRRSPVTPFAQGGDTSASEGSSRSNANPTD